MYELYPYFTNDGSVGLFNHEVQDIYHSTYGALREGYEKFILPANLETFFKSHDEIKVLDICYGIGYNTKSLLNYLLENNYLKISNNFSDLNQKNSYQSSNIDPIGSDNNCKVVNNDEIHSNNNSKFESELSYNEQIDNDKVFNKEDCHLSSRNNAAIHSNNFCNAESIENHHEEKQLPKIYIKALDIDETLVSLSPFIRQGSYKDKIKYNQKLNFKYPKVTKLLNEKFEAKYLLKNEVNLLLFKIISQKFPDFYKNITIWRILEARRFAQFFDQIMVALYWNFKNIKKNYAIMKDSSTFLHNIYYNHISESYKKVLNLPLLNDFDFEPVIGDARISIQEDTKLYNFIFLDAFTPAKCPSLWSLEFFKLLFEHLEDDGIILTYSNSAAVRNAMLNAGFFVGKIFNEETKKFTGTIAAKDKSLIKYELSEYDLGLINSKAGIFYRDEDLNSYEDEIIAIHKFECKYSNKISSSRFIKNYRSEHEV